MTQAVTTALYAAAAADGYTAARGYHLRFCPGGAATRCAAGVRRRHAASLLVYAYRVRRRFAPVRVLVRSYIGPDPAAAPVVADV